MFSENDNFLILFHNSPDAMILTRVSDGAYIDVNAAAERITGFSKNEFLGNHTSTNELNLWVDAEDRDRLVNELREKGQVYMKEMRGRRKDGSVGIGQTSAIFIQYNNELCLLSITRDVSAQKWDEISTRESQKRYQHLAEENSRLLEIYSDRITSALDMPTIVSLLRDEVLPSLFVHQSALLWSDNLGYAKIIYADQVDMSGFPCDLHIGHAYFKASFSGNYPGESNPRLPHGWVRLSLPLKLSGRPYGVWLLGNRQDNAGYEPSEIAILQALASQTTIAMVNIDQNQRLNAMYQADIERQEAIRSRLARELHDDVLGQMALLSMSLDKDKESPQFQKAYQSAVAHIRQIIDVLRPTMLNFGLSAAIDELADNFTEMHGEAPAIEVHIDQILARYSPDVELHLYRIVQQACQNALAHAKASLLTVTGKFRPDEIELSIHDDGVGLIFEGRLTLEWLLAHKHFGLVGMYERAELIGANLRIESSPGQGTTISIQWRDKQKDA